MTEEKKGTTEADNGEVQKKCWYAVNPNREINLSYWFLSDCYMEPIIERNIDSEPVGSTDLQESSRLNVFLHV